ncbi:hypothetical protein K1X76_00065 [bacterium]|nr:hypothetical protein [bacterium]
MKNLIYFTILLSSLTFLAHAKEPQNILDYYLLLPEKYFACELPPEASSSQRMAAIQHQNIKNGYIKTISEGFPMEIALFKMKKTQQNMIAVTVSCGAGCMCNKQDFLIYTSNKWEETKPLPNNLQILHEKLAQQKGREIFPYYKLPETGTTIEVHDSEKPELLYKLLWQDDKFVIAP